MSARFDVSIWKQQEKTAPIAKASAYIMNAALKVDTRPPNAVAITPPERPTPIASPNEELRTEVG